MRERSLLFSWNTSNLFLYVDDKWLLHQGHPYLMPFFSHFFSCSLLAACEPGWCPQMSQHHPFERLGDDSEVSGNTFSYSLQFLEDRYYNCGRVGFIYFMGQKSLQTKWFFKSEYNILLHLNTTCLLNPSFNLFTNQKIMQYLSRDPEELH